MAPAVIAVAMTAPWVPTAFRHGAIEHRRRAVEQHDLRRHVLLHSTTTRSAWPQWFAAAGVPGLAAVRHLELDHTYLQLQAAADGLGVALGSLPLIEADLAAGRLVCSLASPELRDDDYQLVIREDRLRDPAIRAFRSWILAAAKKPLAGLEKPADARRKQPKPGKR
jgi:LysR family transcriptional regulator, glycine cleavage system transcriptional activator